ncbi:MAG: S8 family peptidase [Cellulosilyticaceae bacterium]
MSEVKLEEFRVEEIVVKSSEIPNGVNLIQAPQFWELGKRGNGIKIAVVDTGCDVTHIDLKDRIIGGRNFTTEDNSDPNIFQDYNGHGTHVCGTIAGSVNGIGVVGVAPEASLLVLKVLDKKGRGTYEGVVSAINYAITNKVDIISMSLGGPDDVPELRQVIQKAVANNILVVCAAGNNGSGDPTKIRYSYPAYYNDSISVGAIDYKRKPASFTAVNNQVDLAAPGVGILSTYMGGRYAVLSGTSMATPHVAGALALLINWSTEQFGRRLTESEIYSQLVRRTIDLGYPVFQTGNGALYLTTLQLLETYLK